MDDKEIVSAVRASLADKVGKERFDLWFGPSTKMSLHGDALTLEVPSRFVQDWLRTNFRKEIEASCEEVLGRAVDLGFRVDPALADMKPKSKAKNKLRIAQPPQALPNSQESSSPAQTPVAPPLRMVRKFANFETFVVGANNRIAHASAQMVIDKPGYYSPLVLHGPTGVGKTHLVEAIWTSVRKHHRTTNVVYLSAEQFTTQFLEALHGGSGLPNFRRKCRAVDILIVEDVQFFVGKKATLIELLHTIDILSKEGRQLIFTCDAAPNELTGLGSELIARLAGGMAVKLDPADQATRLGILRLKAAELALQVPEEVLQHIASSLTTHARELFGALNRLHVTAQAWKQPVSMNMAQEALSEMVRHGQRVLKLADIEKAVCHTFGLQDDTLQSGSKGKAVSHPRMLAMWLARKHTRAALSEIGDFFGRRSHSTVISAHKKVDLWMNTQASLELPNQCIGIEDAIRRVEEKLRAG